MIRRCALHGETVFVHEGGHSWRCRDCRQARVAARRRTIKATLVEEAGGRCVLCGYDRCLRALEFHHRDPSEKTFALGFAGVTRSLAAAREEARKCVLLCSNCHAEVEDGIVALPTPGLDSFQPIVRGSSMAERRAVNAKVVGSSPTPGAAEAS
jgi:hypothetical protein